MHRSRWRVVVGASIVLAAACASGGAGEDGSSPDARGAGDVEEIVVFAAASLTEAFGEMSDAFTEARPGADVTLNVAASSRLGTQIVEGAPADVYASADTRSMQRLVDAGEIRGDPVVFATNRAVIVVEPGNPLGIAGLGDLTDPDLVVVVCAPEVPCGSYASQIFDDAGVDVQPDSLEANVSAVVTKVALGEADAGIAYVTDVMAADGDVDGVAIPDDVNVVAEYPLAVTTDAASGADEFVDFVLGAAGRQILVDHGFSVP